MAEDTLLTIQEAAAKLRLSRATLFKLIKDGRLQPVRITPRKVLVRSEELERFIEESEKPLAKPTRSNRQK
jgi:excisionase family DNA binding protein